MIKDLKLNGEQKNLFYPKEINHTEVLKNLKKYKRLYEII
jgi:hypothetical protein